MALKPGAATWSVSWLLATSLVGVACSNAGDSPDSVQLDAGGWSAYGGDPGGSRYSSLNQINRENVDRLQVAWTHRTGDVSDGTKWKSQSRFEATPILFGGTLYLSTPFNRVLALNPTTGDLLWSYDPGLDLSAGYWALVSRGVAAWEDASPASGAIPHRRIFLATQDARLICLDASSGKPCTDFGNNGQVDLALGVGVVERINYGVTSPPAIIDDLVVVGSFVGDNRGVEVESGVVRAFDARTGEPRWSWDPIPRSPEADGWETWEGDGARRTGAANAWSIISADPERDLVFIPTGSASPDFYGGERLGSNLHANSVVALRASSGEVVWHFQVVHHDLWDYDVAAQPTLTVVPRDGSVIPATVVSTKMGHIFVLDRESGAPLFPIEERPVPASGVPGEKAWPTQPFPVLPPPLHPHSLTPEEAWGITEEDRSACREILEGLSYSGIYTPPGLEKTLLYPGLASGINWGSAAADPERGVLVVNVNRFPDWIKLFPHSQLEEEGRGLPAEAAATNFEGTPYGMALNRIFSPSGLPCNPPPWGTTVAIDLEHGKVLWETPLGVMPAAKHHPDASKWGSLNSGGPIITGGGLVFVAAGQEDVLRALDIEDGKEVWRAELPAGGQATPMTYQLDGKQYVVIAAGGHSGWGTTLGDYLVAFALP